MVYETPGAPMARNLMEAGHELVLYNRTRSKAEELGAEVATSPREVAERSGVIFTMLPGPPEVEEVVAGEGGLLQGAGEGSLIVDTSTSSPVLARELARTARGERGVGMLDAPVSGGGVAPEKILEVLSGGLAANKVMEVKRDKFLERDFEPGGKVEFHRKDLRIALETGREYGVPLPATAVVCQMF